jgi:hypothetical protein
MEENLVICLTSETLVGLSPGGGMQSKPNSPPTPFPRKQAVGVAAC